MSEDAREFNIGFVIFPDITQLDFSGPLQVLSRVPGATTHIAAETLDPVPTDCGLSLLPTITFATCPDLDDIVDKLVRKSVLGVRFY